MSPPADILLVDDDPTLCELLGALFADEGLSTVVCHDGESGLRKARAGAALGGRARGARTRSGPARRLRQRSLLAQATSL